MHLDTIFLTEHYSLTLLAKEVFPEFLDEASECLIGELDVVSLAQYLDSFVADQSGVVGVNGQIDISIAKVEMYPCDREFIIPDLGDVVV